MGAPATFESFSEELARLVGIFEKNFAHYRKPGYDEASLRQEFLNPLFAALGWDVESKAGNIPSKMLALTPKLRAAKTEAEKARCKTP